MTNFGADEAERDVHLDAWYQDLQKVEEALTKREQVEARMNAREQASIKESVQRFNGVGRGGM